MKVFLVLFLFCVATAPVFAQSATVSWTTTYQTMDGWGASTGYWASNVNLNAPQADMFFSPSSGIGLEYIRTSNTPDGSMPDLPTLKLAVARGAKVLLSMYGPPASMMSNGSFASIRVTCSPKTTDPTRPISSIGSRRCNRAAYTLMFSLRRMSQMQPECLDRRAARHVHQSKSGSCLCICWSYNSHRYPGG